ncbi:MAG: hypothetical protein Q8Q01_03410 [archaeon]|nr:hypothetical protein [archaeon]
MILTVDYHDFSNQNQETVSEQGSIQVTNTGLDNISLTLHVDGLSTDYSSVDITKEVLAGETNTISFTVKIPHKEGNGEKNIGTIIVKNTVTNEEVKRIPLVQDTISMLELTEVEVDYINADGGRENEDLDTVNDDNFNLEEKVQVGSEISFTFKLRNLFDRDYEKDYSFIESIRLEIDADDSDIFPNDFESKYDLEDLDAREDQDITVTFIIDENADAGDYNLEFTLIGEDGKGAEYRITRELNVDINRKRDDVRITDYVLTPDTICSAESTTLHVELQNLGTRDQLYAGFVIYNKDLGINVNIKDINLDRFGRSGDKWERDFKITLPVGVKTGVHYLDLRSFANKDDLSQSEIARLTVDNCVSKNTDTADDSDSGSIGGTTDSEPNVKTTTGSTNNNTVRTVEDPYTTEDIIVAGLIVAMILVLAFIFLFIVMLIKR